MKNLEMKEFGVNALNKEELREIEGGSAIILILSMVMGFIAMAAIDAQ